MSLDDETVQLLRGTGYKLTPQRLMVISALRQHTGHLTAAAIHKHVTQAYPYVDISTVYRTMAVLKDLRLVTETDLGTGETVFEWTNGERHHHLVCHGCGTLTDLQDDDLVGLGESLRAKYGFVADIDHFAIFGYCRDCLAAGRARPHETAPAGKTPA